MQDYQTYIGAAIIAAFILTHIVMCLLAIAKEKETDERTTTS